MIMVIDITIVRIVTLLSQFYFVCIFNFVLNHFFQSSGGDDEPMSDNEMSRDGDSPDALSRVPPTDVDPDTLEKLKQQVRK